MGRIVERGRQSRDPGSRGIREGKLAGPPPRGHLVACGTDLILIQTFVPPQVEPLRGKSEACSRLTHDLAHPEKDVLADRVEVVPVPCQCIDTDVYVECRRAIAREADANRVLFDPRMALEHLPQLRQNEAQVIGLRLVAEPDRRTNQHSVASRPVHDLHVGEARVGYRDQGAIEASDHGRTQADRLHGARVVSDGTEVAYTDRPVREEDQSTDQVLQRRAHGQSYRDASDAEASHQPEHGEADCLCAVCEDRHASHHAEDANAQADEIGVEPLMIVVSLPHQPQE